MNHQLKCQQPFAGIALRYTSLYHIENNLFEQQNNITKINFK